MKPNFNSMSRTELLNYIKQNRTDDEAWRIFLERRNPNAKKYPAPLDEDSIKIMEEAFREKLHLLGQD